MTGRFTLLAIALCLCLSAPAFAEEKAPSLDKAQDVAKHGMTHAVQMLGWAKDERLYALRVYELEGSFFEDDVKPVPFCKGYVDHTGKPFRGGLSFVLYQGGRQTGGWRIQDAKTCTPPDAARERLDQAKAALAEQGIDLTLLGATVTALPEATTTVYRTRPDEEVRSRSSASVVLPHGPWARGTVELKSRVEARLKPITPETEGLSILVASSPFELTFQARGRTTRLHEFRLGPFEYSGSMVGSWSTGLDRFFLSPTGTKLVAFAYAKSGNMRGYVAPRIHLGFVDLAERLGAAPKAISPAR